MNAPMPPTHASERRHTRPLAQNLHNDDVAHAHSPPLQRKHTAPAHAAKRRIHAILRTYSTHVNVPIFFRLGDPGRMSGIPSKYRVDG